MLNFDQAARIAVECGSMEETFGPLEMYGAREPVVANDNEQSDFVRFNRAFRYEPDTGKIVRLEGPDAGVVKTKYPNGYIRVNFEGRGYLGHRVAWLLVTGEWPGAEVDHDNLVKDDNRWVNLRESDHSGNMGNRAAYANNKCGMKGASFNKRLGRWQAFIQKDKRHRYLGLFDTAEAAHAAYAKAASEHFGKFARAS